MKLIKIENKRQIKGARTISFGSKGTILLSKKFMSDEKLDDNPVFNFYQDGENPKDWYFKQEKEGVRFRKMESGACIGNAATITNKLLESLSKQKASMLISEQKFEGYYIILTSSAK